MRELQVLPEECWSWTDKKSNRQDLLLGNNIVINLGEWTESEVAKPGDKIEWRGYLQNGAVSALKIKKLK